jgi:hypothetical protein
MCTSIFVLGLMLFVLTSAAFAETVQPSQILSNSSAYDSKHLTVSGTVRNVIAKTSRRGNDFETFDLCDNSCVKVFAWGHHVLRQGQHLSVSGTFDSVKHVGRYTFYNELDADDGRFSKR